MEDNILKATARTEKPKRVRDAGFIPGILNNSDTSSMAVQFDTIELNKIISKHGIKAKLWVIIDGDKKFGYIKEVQRQPVARKVIHVSIQMVNKDQEVKMLVPINFHGREEIENRLLQLQVLKTDIEVSGKATMMPDYFVIDVSMKELGDHVTAVDFTIPEDFKIMDDENEVYAIIKAKREELVEEVADVEATAAE